MTTPSNPSDRRPEKLDPEKPEVSADRLLQIGKECADRIREPLRSAEHAALLYDDYGLPQ